MSRATGRLEGGAAQVVEIAADFLAAAFALAQRRAARDAHRLRCARAATACATCRLHSERIASAKATLRDVS
jgi:hypothetical protein